MREDRWLVLAVGFAALVAVGTFPLLGAFGSVPAGAAAFYVVVLVASGYRIGRTLAWGVLVGLLFALGVLATDPLAPLSTAAGTALFFAAVLLPSFRSWWFGQAIE